MDVKNSYSVFADSPNDGEIAIVCKGENPKEVESFMKNLEKELTKYNMVRTISFPTTDLEGKKDGIMSTVFLSNEEKENQNFMKHIINTFDKMGVNYKDDVNLKEISNSLKVDIVEISKDNENNYPFDQKRKYEIIEKTEDISVIEYDKEKNLYGVVFSETQLTHVGSREACLAEMPLMQKGYNEHWKDEMVREDKFIDPTDFQSVDMNNLEYKKDHAELLGISLDEYNKRDLAKSSVDIYPNGKVEVLIYDKGFSIERPSEECIQKTNGFETELKKNFEIMVSRENYSFREREGEEGFKLVIQNSIKNNKEEGIQKHIINAMDKFSIDYSNTPIKHLKKYLGMDEGEKKPKVVEIPFSKNDDGLYVLKSIDDKEYETLKKKEGFDHKMVYREYVDVVGETNFILSKDGEAFSKKNGINPTAIGQFDYSEKELTEKKSLLENKDTNQQEVKSQKPNVMDNEKKEHKDQVIGFANKHNWSENDPSNKTYYLESVSQKKILEQKGDEYGSVRLGIKKVDREVTNEGQVQKGSSYRVILYPKKDDPNIEAVISVKKEEVAKLKGEGDYKNVDLLVTNRHPLKASKDDLAVSNNPLEKGMSSKEQKKAMDERIFVGTGWTQKPELYALDKSQINTEELKRTIIANQSVKSQAIVLQGGKGLVTKEVVDVMKEAKEKNGEKFKPEIEKLVLENFKEEKKKGERKGMNV